MIKRVVSTGFWTDDKVVYNFTPEDKYFMLYLLSNPHTTQLGIYRLNIKYAAFETGYDEKTIEALINRFENHLEIIYYSYETGEVAIKNYLIHSIIKGGKPVADLLWKEINDVKNKDLVTKVFNHIKDSEHINKTVRNIIDIYLDKYKNINEIHNENENDKSYHLSYHDSSNESLNCENPKKVDRFQEFWDAYPKKQHRALAEQAYVKSLINGSTEEWLIEAAKEYALCVQGTESRYIKNPENWLDDNLYLDYPAGTYKQRQEDEKKKKTVSSSKKNSFNNFEPRNIEMSSLERQLLDKSWKGAEQ